jgi:hypothetical protein
MADKVSSVLCFVPEILLHVSRGVRWDSDHVVTLTDELNAIAQELVRGNYLSRTHIGLDFFDASINRIAAWVIGTRNMLRALLIALLEPPRIREAELAGDSTTRLAMQEEAKTLPFGAVWDANQHERGPAAILSFLAGGGASREIQDIVRSGGTDAIVDHLRWLGRPTRVLASRLIVWEDDPWARGGYAFFDSAFDPASRDWLARPHGRVMFAGEHTSIRWQGYMNGAVESGQRAAAEIAAIHLK